MRTALGNGRLHRKQRGHAARRHEEAEQRDDYGYFRAAHVDSGLAGGWVRKPLPQKKRQHFLTFRQPYFLTWVMWNVNPLLGWVRACSQPRCGLRLLVIPLGLQKEAIMRLFSPRVYLIGLCLAAWLSAGQSAFAQGPLEVQAALGEPFGVGSVTLTLPAEMLPEPLGIEGLGVSEKSGRVFYPAMRTPAVAGMLKEFLSDDNPLTAGGPVRQEVGGILRDVLNRPPRTTIYFLFRGGEPLELIVQARKSIRLVVQPRNAPALHRRLLDAWWRDYAAPRRLLRKARLSAASGDVPGEQPCQAVESEVAPRAAGGIRLPAIRAGTGALTGSEGIRTALEQDRAGRFARQSGGRPAAASCTGRSAASVSRCPERTRRQALGTQDRADRAARTGRIFLHPLRQLRQLPLVSGHA